jgi:hypothetical protein
VEVIKRTIIILLLILLDYTAIINISYKCIVYEYVYA